MSWREEMSFDHATGQLVLGKAPTLEEFMAAPEKYPDYEMTMDYNTGKMEIFRKTEAQRRTDKQVVKGMAADGFFQPMNT